MAERLSTKAGSNRPDKAQFRATVREIVLLKQEAESAQSAVMHRFKNAKKAGFNLNALRKAIAAREEDPEIVAQEMSDQIEYLWWSGVKVPGFQPDLFADGERPTVDGLSEKERAEEDMWQAEQRGYQTGRAGGDRFGANSHPPGSELHVAFDTGYLRGMAAIAREMGPDAGKATKEKNAQAPRSGGRRRKTGNAEDGPPADPPAGDDKGAVH